MANARKKVDSRKHQRLDPALPHECQRLKAANSRSLLLSDTPSYVCAYDFGLFRRERQTSAGYLLEIPMTPMAVMMPLSEWPSMFRSK